MITNFTRRLERIESGRYRLVERWREEGYGDMEHILSFINRVTSHKWTYTYYGYLETAKTLKEALEVLRQTYDF